MKTLSLKQRLLSIIAGLLLFSLIAVLISVWVSTSKSGRTQLTQALEVGQDVLRQTFINRENLLINSAQVLTDDFGFKQAVASKDDATINSVLMNHGARINADLMLLLDLQGKLSSYVLFNSDETNGLKSQKNTLFLDTAKLDETLNYSGATHWFVIDNSLYQAILLTVDAPRPIAIAAIGFKVDESILASFDKITQLHSSITIISDQVPQYSASTLEQAQQADLNIAQLSWLALASNRIEYVSDNFVLSDDKTTQVKLSLHADVSDAFSSFRALQSIVISIAIITVLLALLLAIWLSRKITDPISQLVEVTTGIASGAYDRAIPNASTIPEVFQLSSAFSKMQRNVKHREEKIRYQAEHDHVTGMFNQTYMRSIIEQALATDAFGVFAISLSDFRQVKDSFGNQCANEYLLEIAKRLELFSTKVARLSEHSFVCLCPADFSQKEESALVSSLKAGIIGDAFTISPRITVARLNCPADANSADELYKKINICFDESKRLGLNQIDFHPDLELRYTRRLNIVAALRETLNNADSELTMVYQPKLNLKTKKVSKIEALIRWNSPILGFVPPDEFIEIAEQANLIKSLSRWVIHRVILDVKNLRTEHPKLCAAINLAAKDIMDGDLLPWILHQLHDAQLPVSCLSFEITESDLVEDPEIAAKHMAEYRDAGFDLAIDDFGTGYSSLSYLQQLPVSEIKIDKSFVLKLATNISDQNIVKHVIALAQSFKLRVIAEGVEDEQALALLSDYGCDWAQGYHMSRPIDLNALFSFLEQESIALGSENAQ